MNKPYISGHLLLTKIVTSLASAIVASVSLASSPAEQLSGYTMQSGSTAAPARGQQFFQATARP